MSSYQDRYIRRAAAKQ